MDNHSVFALHVVQKFSITLENKKVEIKLDVIVGFIQIAKHKPILRRANLVTFSINLALRFEYIIQK